MRNARIAVGTVLALAAAGGGASPATAQPARANAHPRILSAKAVAGPERSVTVTVVGRDRDDVARGAEIAWGELDAGEGLSACEQASHRSDRRRRGKRARFVLSHAYAAPGDYEIAVQILSGGCGKRPQQRSPAQMLRVHVD